MKKKRELIRLHMHEIPFLCEHFQAMAKRGWMLYDYTSGLASYKKVEPQDVTYMIHIASKYKPFSIHDAPSMEDQEFIAFAQEYGFENICSHNAYQLYKSNETVEIPLYTGSFEEYLEEHKQSIRKYEFWCSHLPALGFFLLFCTFFFITPAFQRIMQSQSSSVITYPFLSPLFFSAIVFVSYPSIKKHFQKEHYHTDFESIHLRSSLTFLIILSYTIAFASGYLPFPSWITFGIYLALTLYFFYCIFIYYLHKFTHKMIPILIFILVELMITFSFMNYIFLPYKNETAIIPKEYTCYESVSSILWNRYSLHDKQDQYYSFMILQNEYVQPYILSLLDNELLLSKTREDDWYSYILEDGSTYLIKGNKVLFMNTEVDDVELLKQYIIDFHM